MLLIEALDASIFFAAGGTGGRCFWLWRSSLFGRMSHEHSISSESEPPQVPCQMLSSSRGSMRCLAFGGGARGGAGPFFSCCFFAAGAACELELAPGRGAGPFLSTVRGFS